MTTANKMLEGITTEQLKEAVATVGGFHNFQVKFQGKPCKSYLLPEVKVPSRILRQWNICKLIS